MPFEVFFFIVLLRFLMFFKQHFSPFKLILQFPKI